MGRFQAKQISDIDLLAAVAAEQPLVRAGRGWRRASASRWDVADRSFPGVPGKVVVAKARTLIRQGRLRGCACGCRGDWELPVGAASC